MNENDEGTPTGDTTTQLKWIPQRYVGSNEVGTSKCSVQNAGLELERIKRRLEAFEERSSGRSERTE